MKNESIRAKTDDGLLAEITLVTAQAALGFEDKLMLPPGGPVPPISLPRPPDIGPMPICLPMCNPACLPSFGIRPFCIPDVSMPKPLPPKPKP